MNAINFVRNSDLTSLTRPRADFVMSLIREMKSKSTHSETRSKQANRALHSRPGPIIELSARILQSAAYNRDRYWHIMTMELPSWKRQK